MYYNNGLAALWATIDTLKAETAYLERVAEEGQRRGRLAYSEAYEHTLESVDQLQMTLEQIRMSAERNEREVF